MADEETKPDEEAGADGNAKPKKSGSITTAIVWGTLGMLFGSGGFAIPMMMAKQPEVKAEEVVASETPAFVEFGEIVVNLNSDRLNRYLRINITLLVKELDQTQVTELVDLQKAKLKSWLLSYLSDASMEDIRGAAGQNRLRRDIQDKFNTVLFEDGYDRIRDVLFQEFNVQ